jgi:drug/metabolite transporter (DMT)-like permease
MTIAALLLVLISAVFHATWNYLAKRTNGGATFVWLYDTTSLVLYAPVVIFFIIWQRPTLTGIGLIFIAGSGLLHLAYFILLQNGYRVGDLSLVYPLARGTGPLLASLIAIVIFGEHPTPIALVGIALILLGVFLVSGGPRIFSRGTSRLGIIFGLVIGCFIAGYTLWDKHGVSVVLVSPLFYEYGATIVRVVLMTPYAVMSWGQIRQDWQTHRFEAIGIAVLSPLAYLLVLIALVFTPVSYVAPAREVGVLIGAFLGAHVLSEGDTRRRMLAAGMIVLGIAALAL